MSIPQRTIEEVKARLFLEKEIKEIYVEGNFDRDILNWILKKLEIDDIRVYPISTINVPAAKLKSLDLTSGNRQRVIAVSRELKDIKKIHSQVIFLIDADFDYIFDVEEHPEPLKRTSYASLEIILWKKSILEKLLSLTFGKDNYADFIQQIIDTAESISSQVFLFRAAKEKIGADWKLVELADQIDKNNNFCFEKFCTKVADKNSARKIMKEDFPGVHSEMLEKAKTVDEKRRIHGHDLINVLAKILKNRGFSQGFLNNHDEFSRILLSNIEWQDIEEEGEVVMIKNHFQCGLPA